MSIEFIIVGLYLIACIAIGVVASRRVLASSDEYWVAGRGVGRTVNAIAIMATLASGGSIVGVMGLAYKLGIPLTLALFAGAVVGFPLASVLIARPLRNFGKFTISDFLSFRYRSPLLRVAVPVLIVVAFTVYIVAQLKAAGITAEVLLGVDYNTALIVSTVVFVLYVSFGGMLAVTWTDVAQGTIMIGIVLAGGAFMLAKTGTPAQVLTEATAARPELGQAGGTPFATVGYFLLWACAIPVIPHIVMRVYTAKDAEGARWSLNMAMVAYSAIILTAVLVIVPIGSLEFGSLDDPDRIFHMVVEHYFPPALRGVAVAAVIAAVMSTVDALLLACSSAIAHDLVSVFVKDELSARTRSIVNIAVVTGVGVTATILALNPPELLTQLYSVAVGSIAASLFVPVVSGIWWKRANELGALLAFAAGLGTYLVFALGSFEAVPALGAMAIALPASILGMVAGSLFGTPPPGDVLDEVHRMHAPEGA